MRCCTVNQLVYIKRLLRWCDEVGSLEDVIIAIKPDLEEDEEFEKWIAKQSVARASEVIDILKEHLS